MKVVELPTHNLADVSGGLRRLADDIDAGSYGDAFNLVWIIDCGNARIEHGMLGNAGEPAATAIMLMEMSKHKLIAETLCETR